MKPSRGFTLVELMVAITGGLFLSIVVFALARDGARFYQRESRVASATLGTIVGFERLRADLTRAGFLTSPNVRRDPNVCAGPAEVPNWPVELARMASVRINADPALDNETLTQGDTRPAPDRIVLAGSFASADQFPIRSVQSLDGSYQVMLQPKSAALGRLGYLEEDIDQPAQQKLLESVFGAGRALRIVDKAGMQHFGTIQSVNAGAVPVITLGADPPLRIQSAAGTRCGLKPPETGALVNVVNFVRYEVRSLRDHADYDAVYQTPAPFDDDRTELVRVELDTNGSVIPGTEELVAEYAVDLRFGLTVMQLNAGEPALTTLLPGAQGITQWAGDTSVLAPNQGPQLIKAVRVRLSVRSREADREGQIDPGAGTVPSMYRIGLGPGGGAPFARVRTVQSEIALRNQLGAQWM